MKIAILDYCVGEVNIHEAPEMDTTEEIEAWLENLGYKSSQISWMAGVTRINDMTL